MKNIFGLLIVAFGFLTSCNQVAKKDDKVIDTSSRLAIKTESLNGKPIVSVQNITKDFSSFWSYYNQYIEFYKDFKALDTAGNTISRVFFLKQLTSGLYFPLALYDNDSLNYQLAKIPVKASKDIGAYMQKFSKEQLEFCKLEGKPIPAFNFTDVNGKVYTSANTKGKIVMFKCWFISCVACVAEMPALNDIVAKYKDRDDILFISLAMDSKRELQTFLAKRQFDYATIPNQTEYMKNQLHVAAYPTHFIINKKGEMVRMLPNEVKVEEAIEMELAK